MSERQAKLSDNDEALFRQIHPSWMDGDHPSSQPFVPTPKDDGKVSLDRSAVVTAEQSFVNYTKDKESVAVYGLTVGEFSVEQIDCFEDPIAAADGVKENLAHSLADYSPHAPSRQKTIAKRLKRIAIERGVLYAP